MLSKRFSHLIRLIAIISLSYFTVSCGDGEGPAPVNDTAAPPPPSEAYTLVWSDEFDVDGAPDVKNWRMETGYGDDNSGWGNDEWQLYTDDTSSENNNVRVEAGNLVITARCSKAETAPAECNDGAFAARTGIITSARINSKDKFEVKYGNIQARIKTPPGKGTWPAFWMLGSVFPEQPWPGAGEIDIMEMHQFYSNDRTTHFTMHWCDDSIPGPVPCQFDPGWTLDSQFKTFDEVLTDDYHIFEADWDEDRIIGKIDGNTYFSKPIDPGTQEEFLKSFFMILNVAVGGTLGGPPNDSTTWPQEMLVDWVRVYQKNKPDVVELWSDDRTAPLPFERFVNSAEFGGDSVVAKIQRTVNEEDEDFDVITPPAVTPLTGNTIVEFDYESANTFFSGGAFSFKSKDISSFSKVVFSLDTSAFPNFDDIVVEMVDSRNAGGATGKVQLQLSNYIPKITSNWKTYEISLSDFNGVNLDNVDLFGFWNPVNSADQLIAGKLYIDGIRFVSEPCTTDGSVAFDSINYNPATSVASVSVDDICAASSLVVVKVETGTDEIAVGVNLDAAGKGETIFNLVKPDSVCSTDDGLSLIKLSLSSSLMATYTRTYVDADGTQQVNTATATAGVDPSAPGTSIVGEKSYFYATDPSQALSFLPDVNFAYSIFGSGSILNGNFSDTTFDPVFAVTSGTEYGGGIHVAQVALIGGDAYPAFTGFAEGTETINFKIKNLPADNVIDVEFGILGGPSQVLPVDVTTSIYSTSIGDGWYEVSIPMTEFPNGSTYNFMAFTAGIGTTDIFTFLITDIFLQDSAGNVPAECDNVILPPVDGSGTGATGATGGPFSVSFDDSAVTYGFIGFGAPDTSTSLNADPVDVTNMVAVTTKPVGAQVWAGVTVETVPGITWPVSVTKSKITIRIYSPGPGLVVHMKLEESGTATNSVEAEAVTTVTTGWETLTFDFSNPVAGSPAINPAFAYDKLSLFFGFGTVGDGTTYTWDTIEFLGTVPPPAGGETLTNGTFEAGDTSGWSLVANDGTFTATMDQAASGDWSGNLVASVPAGGGPASFPVASQNNFALGTVTPGQSVTVSFDICGELTGAGGVVQTALLSEIAGGGASATDQLFGNITPTDTWVNYTMTTLSGTDVTGGLTLQLKSDCGGNPGCTVNAYFDNVSVVLDSDVGNPSNAGGSCAGGGGTPTEPTVAAPTPPSRMASGVKSMFSDAYTDEPIDTWRTIWSMATLDETFVVDGSATKLYTDLDFVGIEATGPQIDASAMTHFHVDVWTPDDTTAGVFRIKLVDFGASTTEAELVFDSATTPALTTGSWSSLDIPLSDFTGLAGTANIQQLIFSATLGGGPGGGTVYIDNVYFYANGGGAGGELAVNGNFETGDFTGWTQFESATGNQTVNPSIAGDTSSEGSFHAQINNTTTETNSLFKQERVGLGTVAPGIAWTVTFDARGNLDSANGAVAFAEFFCETNGGNETCGSGVGANGILGDAPLAINADPTVWTPFSFSGTAGPNTESLTLQLGAITGASTQANMFYDNISIVVGGP